MVNTEHVGNSLTHGGSGPHTLQRAASSPLKTIPSHGGSGPM